MIIFYEAERNQIVKLFKKYNMIQAGMGLLIRMASYYKFNTSFAFTLYIWSQTELVHADVHWYNTDNSNLHLNCRTMIEIYTQANRVHPENNFNIYTYGISETLDIPSWRLLRRNAERLISAVAHISLTI